ncbi:MAG TPA: M50 family metallopeptidase [Actinomycetota bacterium]|nr:M50 family metallopeptidase [Actinomycetota bacterium]
MTSSGGVIAFILTLVVMVIVHEFGHYITAKRFGMRVEEYFFGFGPRIFSRRIGETEYGIKAIPLGGYVRISGMNPWQQIPDEEIPRTFGAKPSWQRAIVLGAGSFTHFVLAFLIFTAMYGVVGLHDPDHPTTKIERISETVDGQPGPAKVAGLQQGDKVIAVNARAANTWDKVRAEIRKSPGVPITLDVLRDGKTVSVSVTPLGVKVPVDEAHPARKQTVGQIGVVPTLPVKKESLPRAVVLGAQTTGVAIARSVVGIGSIFSPHGISRVFGALGGSGRRSADQPFGLVGSARLAGEVASAGEFETLVLFLTGFIVFVGVINLVPLPPLDGGHLLVLLIEKVRRRKVDMRKVVPVAGVVLSFLVILTVVLLYLDIVRPVSNPFQ